MVSNSESVQYKFGPSVIPETYHARNLLGQSLFSFPANSQKIQTFSTWKNPYSDRNLRAVPASSCEIPTRLSPFDCGLFAPCYTPRVFGGFLVSCARLGEKFGDCDHLTRHVQRCDILRRPPSRRRP